MKKETYLKRQKALSLLE